MSNVLKLEPKRGRVPPSDLDAEAAVLSAALIDSSTIEVSRAIVRPEHFYADANRRIFSAILELFATGKPTDLVMVAGFLRDTGRLEQIGGSSYLAQIADATPAVANVAPHAQRIHEKWRIRQLVSSCHKFAAEGYGDVGDVQAFIENASSALRTIAECSAVKAFPVQDSTAIFAQLSDPDYLIDRVVRRASLIELVAYGASGKTFLAVDASIAVATGQPFLGRFPCKAGLVTYFDYENGNFEMRRRFQAIARSRSLSLPVAGIELCSMPNGYMSDGAEFGARMMAQAKGRDLIIIDTLKAANPGVDENDSNMRLGLDELRRVAEATGCAFMVLVHAKKVSGSLTSIDAREAGRGSSAIFDAADSVLHVTYEEGKPLRVTQTKARTGRSIEPFDVTIEDTAEGIAVRAVDAPKPNNQGARDRLFALSDRVLEVVKLNPGASGRVIRAQVDGARPESILAAIELLEQHGAIRNAGTTRGAKWFPTGKPTPKDDEWADFGD